MAKNIKNVQVEIDALHFFKICYNKLTKTKNKGVCKMIISLILIALFIILLPFCPLWAGCHNEKGNVDILHIHLWALILHRLFAKNSREKLQVLSYRQVVEMYNNRIKD